MAQLPTRQCYDEGVDWIPWSGVRVQHTLPAKDMAAIIA
jgi:hypothetical protein